MDPDCPQSGTWIRLNPYFGFQIFGSDPGFGRVLDWTSVLIQDLPSIQVRGGRARAGDLGLGI